MTETKDERPPEDQHMWVIYNKSERGFWSNDDGWVDLPTATRFSGSDMRRYNPPTGGVFITEAQAQTALWPGCGQVVQTDESCLSVSAVVTVSLAVSLAFDPDERVPDEQRLKEIFLENFAAHPGLEDKSVASDLKYDIIDAHEE